jgi:hypothetical protein
MFIFELAVRSRQIMWLVEVTNSFNCSGGGGGGAVCNKRLCTNHYQAQWCWRSAHVTRARLGALLAPPMRWPAHARTAALHVEPVSSSHVTS